MSANRPDAADLVARAHALAPVLFSRADEAEKLRHCPRASVEDWFAAGLDLAHKPERFGGSELPWDVLCETALALGHGCAAQGCVLTVYGDHTQALGMFPKKAQDEVWADPRALISASFGAMGKARKVKGGAILNGKWSFSSGVDHATWVLAGRQLLERHGQDVVLPDDRRRRRRSRAHHLGADAVRAEISARAVIYRKRASVGNPYRFLVETRKSVGNLYSFRARRLLSVAFSMVW